MNPGDLTKKEAAAALGVSKRQFDRYRERYEWLQPVALTGMVPVFTTSALERLRKEVLRDKLAVLAAAAARRRKTRRKPRGRSAHEVVSMERLRSARKGAA